MPCPKKVTMAYNPKLSVAIITRNEADRITNCLQSVYFADEMVIVDSGSTDDTAAIAQQFGGKVIHQPFLGFGPQKQFAVDHCNHDWVLLLDADERVPEVSVAAILKAVRSAEKGAAAFEIQRKNFLHGRWIRHCGWWPDPLIRIVNRKQGRFSEDMVHERWLTDGKVRSLLCVIEHRSFRNYSDMIEKLQHYSSLGAAQMGAQGHRSSPWSPLLHGFWTFVQVYGLRLGFLDGFDGFMIALLNAGGSFMKYAKCWEAMNYMNKE